MINTNKWLCLLLFVLCGRCAAAETFAQWKDSFARKAQAADISPTLLAQFQQITPYQAAISNDSNQAEFKKFLWEYIASAVSASRVSNGRKKFTANQSLLNNISKQSGVAPQIIVAIWGMETAYGSFTGDVPVMRAMATLAYEGRRRSFFEHELLQAMQLMQSRDLPDFNVLGSWAGGLGMTQFIPSSYNRYGIDYNGDGVRNLWQTPDALASTANYLAQMGWRAGYRWGREVLLPNNFDYRLANDSGNWLALGDWGALGISDIYGQALPDADIVARLLVPAGQFGPKFLLYKNFDVIKRYNNSDAYALAVSLLSDQIIGKPGLRTPWPTNAKKLSKSDIKNLQQVLNAHGFDAGTVDGIFGNGTRRALQQYQAAKGLVADGFLSTDLYRLLIPTN